MSELLIGAGNSLKKKICYPESNSEWTDLVTLDIDARTKPTVVHDLNVLPYPFADNTFDEIHAYEVLEHCGRQGDWKFFFAQWQEFWRILKPDGIFCGTVPMWDSPWAWGDPGHTRVITEGSLIFLSQANYVKVGATPMSDYRDVYTADFEGIAKQEGTDMFGFVLRAKK